MDSQAEIPTGSLLIVDDDAYVIKSLVRLLRPSCNQIFTALNGEDALVILIREQIDVIVSDVLLPPITGIELFRRAKNVFPDMTTVMLSGEVSMPIIVQAKHEHIINSVISKPWDNEGIITTIHKYLSMAPQTQLIA